jgi:hypothetical protein
MFGTCEQFLSIIEPVLINSFEKPAALFGKMQSRRNEIAVVRPERHFHLRRVFSGGLFPKT